MEKQWKRRLPCPPCLALMLVAVFGGSGACRDDSPNSPADQEQKNLPDGGTGNGDAASPGNADTTSEPADGAEGTPSDESPSDGDPSEALDCANYSASPYGTALGDVIEKLGFEPATTAALEAAGSNGTLETCDLFQASEANGGQIKAVMFWLTAGWCPYCAQEANLLNRMYQELRDEGIQMVAVVVEDDLGQPADVRYAASYARRYRWEFPAVPGRLPPEYWPANAVATGEIGFPLHLMVDARTMKLHSRLAGAPQSLGLLQDALRQLAQEARWNDDGTPMVNFDCNPDFGNEVEPNGAGAGEHPLDGTRRPSVFEGTLCGPTIGDGDVMLDIDIVNLGFLPQGSALDINIKAQGSGPVRPYAQLVRGALSEDGLLPLWSSQSPAWPESATGGRQWVIDTDGEYFLVVMDGRSESPNLYGSSTPEEEQCCKGGPDHLYRVEIKDFPLRPTEAEMLTRGVSQVGVFESGRVKVHPLPVTPGDSYTVTMTADDTSQLDPYLLLYDPATLSVVGFNDDLNTAEGDRNSRVTYDAPEGATMVWVVASFWGAWFKEPSLPYTIQVD